MIVGIRRNGMAASVSATRQYTAGLMKQPSSRIVSRSLTTRHLASATNCSSFSLRSPYRVRYYSTPLPPTDKRDATATPLADLTIPGQQQRARKVELHPAPVKSNPPSSTTSTKRAPPSATLAKQPDTPLADSAKQESIISTAKHDVEEAAQHGILAPPPPDAGRFRKLLHQAKELFKFYYRGLKLINTNRQRAKVLEARVKAGGPPLTRWEHRFIRTYKEDVVKLVPFALIILIAEEIIPLVVLYAPFILPSTCILPTQKERIDSQRRAKQQAFASSNQDVFERIIAIGAGDSMVEAKQLLDGPSLVATSGILGHSNYSLSTLRARRIRRHLSAVAEDDALLWNEGSGSRLTSTELADALSERGIITEGLSVQQQQARLRWWLTEVNKASTSNKTLSSPPDPIARRVVLISRSALGRL
ncbi:hypothetical protein BDW22DRAFT_1355001 [Trametopsis cervina]|nr:hypothetical protein BDW22DRAFT_1355001 [Trametopsis cervina]